MKPSTALRALVVAALAACGQSGSKADAHAQTPAPGHVLTKFVLEERPYCASCTGRLHTELDGIPGISAVETRVDDPILSVWHDEQAMPKQKILDLLLACGEKVKLP